MDRDPTDETLMGRVAAGDLEALRPLFERHREPLFGFFWRATGRPDLSEDLVQEVFIRLVRRGSTWRAGGTFRPWVFRVARSVIADHFRNRESGQTGLEEAPEPVASAEDPGERVDRKRRGERLRRALASLAPDDRDALILSRYEEMPYAEIGRILGATEGAVKVRIHRALKRLRAAYFDLAEEEDEPCTTSA